MGVGSLICCFAKAAMSSVGTSRSVNVMESSSCDELGKPVLVPQAKGIIPRFLWRIHVPHAVFRTGIVSRAASGDTRGELRRAHAHPGGRHSGHPSLPGCAGVCADGVRQDGCVCLADVATTAGPNSGDRAASEGIPSGGDRAATERRAREPPAGRARESPAGATERQVTGLVLVPTRELATQVGESFRT